MAEGRSRGGHRRAGRGSRLRLAHRVVFALVWSILFAEALALPGAFFLWDQAQKSRLEEDVRRILTAVIEPGSFPKATEVVRRGRALVESGLLVGGAVYDVTGREAGVFGDAPGLTQAEAKAGGLMRRTNAGRGTVDIYLPHARTGLGQDLVVTASLADLRAPALHDFWQSAGASLAVAVASALMAFALLWAWIIRPLNTLRGAASAAVREPHAAERFRLGWSRGDEIGETARALDGLFAAAQGAQNDELVAAHEAIAQLSVAIVHYDPDGGVAGANAAALSLFGVADLQALRDLDPQCVRIAQDEQPAWASAVALAGSGMAMRVVRTESGEKRCLMDVQAIRRGEATCHVAALVDLSTQYDYARRLEASVEALTHENDALLRSTTELRHLFESCLAWAGSLEGAGGTRQPVPAVTVESESVIGAWLREAGRAGLVQPTDPEALPAVHAPPAPARVAFRQALLLAYLCSRSARPQLGISGETADGRAVFTVRDAAPPDEAGPARAGSWPLPLAALRAALDQAGGRLVSFAPDGTEPLRFMLPAARSETDTASPRPAAA